MMKQNETESKPEGIVCALCGTPFLCGMVAGQAECWCFRMKPAFPVPQSMETGCWCPACLQAAIDDSQTTDAQK